jgi:ketosteroid isomerase-like protein
VDWAGDDKTPRLKGKAAVAQRKRKRPSLSGAHKSIGEQGSMTRRTRLLLVLALLGGSLSASACRKQSGLSAADAAGVTSTLDEFRRAWLAGDAQGVMSHISDSVTMFIPGPAGTIAGKVALRAYWFPASDTIYPIRKYEVAGQRIFGAGDFALAQGRVALAWDTMVGDSVRSSSTSNSEFLTVLRKENGRWKLFRHMFVNR